MTRWSADKIWIGRHYVWLITQRCEGGWETFIASDEAGSRRFCTISSRTFSLGEATSVHSTFQDNLMNHNAAENFRVLAGKSIEQAIEEVKARPNLKVEVIKAPPGPLTVPEEIRQAWVGIELPLYYEPSPWPLKNEEYAVDTVDAILTLASYNREAAGWWIKSKDHGNGDLLIFPAACCQIVV